MPANAEPIVEALGIKSPSDTGDSVFRSPKAEVGPQICFAKLVKFRTCITILL